MRAPIVGVGHVLSHTETGRWLSTLRVVQVNAPCPSLCLPLTPPTVARCRSLINTPVSVANPWGTAWFLSTCSRALAHWRHPLQNPSSAPKHLQRGLWIYTAPAKLGPSHYVLYIYSCLKHLFSNYWENNCICFKLFPLALTEIESFRPVLFPPVRFYLWLEVTCLIWSEQYQDVARPASDGMVALPPIRYAGEPSLTEIALLIHAWEWNTSYLGVWSFFIPIYIVGE